MIDKIPVTINDVKKPNIIHKIMNRIAIIKSIPDMFFYFLSFKIKIYFA